MQSVSWIKPSISTGVAVLACLLAPLLHAMPYGSGWYGDAQIALANDSNTSRGFGDANTVSDSLASISFGGGYATMIGSNAELILSGYLGYRRYQDNDKLANVTTSLGVRYIFQISPGYKHPWFDTKATVTRLEYASTRGRDGYLLDFRTSINRRLTERFTGRTGYGYHNLFAEGAGFDVARHEWFVGGDYQFLPAAAATFEYAYQHGTFTTSLGGHYTDPSYTAVSSDTAFRTCINNSCSDWYAYATKGVVQKLEAGLTFTLGNIDYDISTSYFRARSQTGRTYDDTYVQLGAIFTFQ